MSTFNYGQYESAKELTHELVRVDEMDVLGVYAEMHGFDVSALMQDKKDYQGIGYFIMPLNNPEIGAVTVFNHIIINEHILEVLTEKDVICSLESLVSHELVHVHQYMRGDLTWEPTQAFQGKALESGLSMEETMQQPHEREAYDLEDTFLAWQNN